MRSKLTILILFILVSLTWGTTWLAMKVAVETIPPLFATGVRFLLAAPFLIAITLLTKTPLLFPVGQRKFQIMVCLFYFAIPFTLMIYGETYVSSGLASIIFANMPVVVLLVSFIVLKEKSNYLQIVGLSIAIISLSCLLLEESKTAVNSQWQGIIALVIAVVLHAIMYVQCKKRSCSVSVLTFNALPCLLAGVILIIGGFFIERPHIDQFSIHSMIATLYLGLFAGIFGILCYFLLQQKASAFQASIVFLIFPVIAVSLENWLYGYSLSTCSMILIMPLAFGILLTLLSQHRQTREAKI